jgi:hypothetical protein
MLEGGAIGTATGQKKSIQTGRTSTFRLSALSFADKMLTEVCFVYAGLDGIEVYQDFTKITAYRPLADLYRLLKTGGSDFHGTGAADEREPGKIPLPVAAVEKILLAARPLWDEALRSRVRAFVQEEGGETSTAGSSKFLDRREDDVHGNALQGREGRDLVGETSGQGGRVQEAEVQSESARNEESGGSGVKYMTWTYTEREGRWALVSPLLLTRSDRDVVVREAERLQCCVEESEWNGYKYLVISWKQGLGPDP